MNFGAIASLSKVASSTVGEMERLDKLKMAKAESDMRLEQMRLSNEASSIHNSVLKQQIDQQAQQLRATENTTNKSDIYSSFSDFFHTGDTNSFNYLSKLNPNAWNLFSTSISSGLGLDPSVSLASIQPVTDADKSSTYTDPVTGKVTTIDNPQYKTIMDHYSANPTALDNVTKNATSNMKADFLVKATMSDGSVHFINAFDGASSIGYFDYISKGNPARLASFMEGMKKGGTAFTAVDASTVASNAQKALDDKRYNNISDIPASEMLQGVTGKTLAGDVDALRQILPNATENDLIKILASYKGTNAGMATAATLGDDALAKNLKELSTKPSNGRGSNFANIEGATKDLVGNVKGILTKAGINLPEDATSSQLVDAMTNALYSGKVDARDKETFQTMSSYIAKQSGRSLDSAQKKKLDELGTMMGAIQSLATQAKDPAEFAKAVDSYVGMVDSRYNKTLDALSAGDPKLTRFRSDANLIISTYLRMQSGLTVTDKERENTDRAFGRLLSLESTNAKQALAGLSSLLQSIKGNVDMLGTNADLYTQASILNPVGKSMDALITKLNTQAGVSNISSNHPVGIGGLSNTTKDAGKYQVKKDATTIDALTQPSASPKYKNKNNNRRLNQANVDRAADLFKQGGK